MLVTPLPGLDFGCTVEGLSLPDAAPTAAEFEQLAVAFERHGLLLLRGQHGLHPGQEVALCRRLEARWSAGAPPVVMEERPPPPPGANLRGSHPPGHPEVSLLGSGPVSGHFGISGSIHPTGPLNWHEEASLGWHPRQCRAQPRHARRTRRARAFNR